MTSGLKPYLIREIQFVKPSRYLGTLACIRVLGAAPEDIHLSYPTKMGDILNKMALALARDEAAYIERGDFPPPPLDKRVILVDDEGQEYPFSWLYINEDKSTKERRQAHEWMFGIEGDKLMVCFEHGSFGYRENKWYHPDAAILNLSKLLNRKMPWTQFGSDQSKRTMLRKGQFYWQDKLSGEDVPVDNFVFVTDDGIEVTLAGSGGRAVLSVEGPAVDGHEWYADYAEALKRMADVLNGQVDYAQFGKLDDEVPYAQAPGHREHPEPADVLMAKGKFVVKSIYASGDVHDAPSLVFKTRQDERVYLLTDSPNWEVRMGKPKSYLSTEVLAACRHQALVELAESLAGNRWHQQKYRR